MVPIDAKLKNTSILPYSYDQYGSAYFLIAQEPTGKWADFCCTTDEKYTNKQSIAARKFSEETRLVFGKYAARLPDLQRAVKLKDIQYYVQKSIDYIQPRITASIRHPAGYYIIYLAQVDYISEKNLNHAVSTPHNEKTRYSWVPAEDFIRAIKKVYDRTKATYKDKHLKRQFYDTLYANHRTIMETLYSNK
jgi:hypothetical protein